jgi:hypothetical protein
LRHVQSVDCASVFHPMQSFNGHQSCSAIVAGPMSKKVSSVL